MRTLRGAFILGAALLAIGACGSDGGGGGGGSGGGAGTAGTGAGGTSAGGRGGAGNQGGAGTGGGSAAGTTGGAATAGTGGATAGTGGGGRGGTAGGTGGTGGATAGTGGATAGSGGGGTSGTAGGTGGTGGAGGTGGGTAADGTPCTADAECMGGHCLPAQTGSRCSALTGCPAVCSVLDVAGTACVAAASGSDPRNQCAADVAACKQATCNGTMGASGCDAPNGTACVATTCAAGIESNRACASGACTTTLKSCNGFSCGATTCNIACTPNSATGCDLSSYCNAAGTMCLPRKPNGTECAAGDECGSGFCIFNQAGTASVCCANNCGCCSNDGASCAANCA